MEMSMKEIESLVEQVMKEMGKDGGKKTSTVSNPSGLNEVLGEGGCEPFDKEYGMMSFGDPIKESPSPYDRINRILHRVHSIPQEVDDERALLYTEAHKKYGGNGGVQIINNAKILAYILENVTINIYPDELIVGEMAAPARNAPVFPEFSYDWIVDELNNSPFYERDCDHFLCSDETKANLLSIADYWKGKNIKDQLESTYLSDEEMKGTPLTGRPVFFPNLYVYGGIGHCCIDYKSLLSNGYGGFKKMILEELSNIEDFSTPEAIEKRYFYQAALISLEAASTYFKRYAALAKEKAAAETNPEEKKILETIADNCEWVSEKPPRGFWDALQLYHLATNIILIEGNGHSVTYADFDTALYPFYEKDMKAGKVTKSFVAQIIESFFVKVFELQKLRDKETVVINAGALMGGTTVMIGGQYPDGSDVTNDLTYLTLEAHNHTRTPAPWFGVRWNDQAPYEFKVKVVEANKIGTGQPKVFNDLGIIPTALAKGIPLEDARVCTLVGCVEIDIPGKEYGAHDAAYFSLPKVLEMAINGGRCVDCGPGCPRWDRCGGKGLHLGPDYGDLSTYKNIEEVKEAYVKQMRYWCDRMIGEINGVELAHADLKPLPYLSGINPYAIASGKDLSAGGALYNFSGPQGVGPATVADSLCAIQQLIFEDKSITGEEYLKCLKNDWEGYEDLYQKVNSSYIHHFGNDDEIADEYGIFASNVFFDAVDGRPNVRGGTHTPGLYSVTANVGLGMMMGASPDGRKAGEPISNCLGPVSGLAGCHDINGPTAMANSAAKFDHQRAGNGTLLNIRFTPNSVAGKQGTNNMINFIEAYFSKKANHIQFNIQTTETLKNAQKDPEKYKGLLVRVAGYSAYFTTLSKPLQDDLISRNAYDEI